MDMLEVKLHDKTSKKTRGEESEPSELDPVGLVHLASQLGRLPLSSRLSRLHLMVGQNPGLGPDKVGLADSPTRNLFDLFPKRFMVVFGHVKLGGYDFNLFSAGIRLPRSIYMRGSWPLKEPLFLSILLLDVSPGKIQRRFRKP
jgi:hypothetical protein